MKPIPPKVLVVDIGETHVKVLVTGQTTRREFAFGRTLSPREMVKAVKQVTADWTYDVVSVGLPGPVRRGCIIANPANLGPGWVGFDFEKAFRRPVKVVNDAAMQARGGYRDGVMLFLGFGTGFGAALVVDGLAVPLDLARLPFKNGRAYEDYVGVRGLKRHGKKRWRLHVLDLIARLRTAFQAEDVVLGGSNVKYLKVLPPDIRVGASTNAFRGGFRLWAVDARAVALGSTSARRRTKQS
jgi:polyphosphate glucokinase